MIITTPEQFAEEYGMSVAAAIATALRYAANPNDGEFIPLTLVQRNDLERVARGLSGGGGLNLAGFPISVLWIAGILAVGAFAFSRRKK